MHTKKEKLKIVKELKHLADKSQGDILYDLNINVTFNETKFTVKAKL